MCIGRLNRLTRKRIYKIQKRFLNDITIAFNITCYDKTFTERNEMSYFLYAYIQRAYTDKKLLDSINVEKKIGISFRSYAYGFVVRCCIALKEIVDI